jgi:hypothetical protein
MTKVETKKHDEFREEIIFQSENLFFILLINQRFKNIRVVDFRSGNFAFKRLYLQNIAFKYKIHKVFTLIEREDVMGWQRLGFVKEGIIPGYYKRSDAYIMSKIFEDIPPQDETPFLQALKKFSKTIADKEIIRVKVKEVKIQDLSRAKKEAMKKILYGGPLAPFHRNGEWLVLSTSSVPKKNENVIFCEYEECFGNAKLDFLYPILTEEALNYALGLLKVTLERLARQGIVAVFSFSLLDQLYLNALFLSGGFRRSGILRSQIFDDSRYQDMFLWTRKI